MKILIISAHPDDAEFAMGGTLLQLAREHDVTLLVLTDGGAGRHGTPAVRKHEQEAVARMLHCSLRWGGIADCNVEYTRERVHWLAGIIREEKPDIVFVPHWDQQGGLLDGKAHPDHAHVGMLTRDAARFARFNVAAIPGERHETKALFYYMVPMHRTPKAVVPVDNVKTELLALWQLHASQHGIRTNLSEYLLAKRREYTYPGAVYTETFDSDGPLQLGMDAFRVPQNETQK